MIFTSKPKKKKPDMTLESTLEFQHGADSIEESVIGCNEKEISLFLQMLILGANKVIGNSRSETAEFVAKTPSNPSMLVATATFLHMGICQAQRKFAEEMMKHESELPDEAVEGFKSALETEIPEDINWDEFTKQMVEMINSDKEA